MQYLYVCKNLRINKCVITKRVFYTPYNQDVGRNCNLLYLMLNVVSRFSNKDITGLGEASGTWNYCLSMVITILLFVGSHLISHEVLQEI